VQLARPCLVRHAVFYALDAACLGAVGTAEKPIVRLNAMSEDL